MKLRLLACLWLGLGWAAGAARGEERLASESSTKTPTAALDPNRATTDDEADRWYADYSSAWRVAAAEQKNLLIVFQDAENSPVRRGFETETLANQRIQRLLQNFVLLRLPLDATTTVDGREVRLLQHVSFAEMYGRPGVAIVDLTHDGKPYYGRVVSAFPFSAGQYYRPSKMEAILTLPPGTITQRTMVYAVRIHPESPQSTWGDFDARLAAEAESHSSHQASITLQGHHNWDSRFHRINSTLPGGLLAQEVVAESWPGKTLVDACVDCVDSWRQSPGHWSAVRSRHPLFGFDIQRGRNGIWYATGIFGRR